MNLIQVPDKTINLTEREIEILKLVAADFTSKELAEYLCISIETVKSHRKSLIRKMGVKTTGGLIGRGFQSGILNAELFRHHMTP